MPVEPLRWAILGTGRIAQTFAKGVADSPECQTVAVGSRSRSSAQEFAKQLDIQAALGSYDEAISDPRVQAVYISLPNHLHAPYSIQAAEHGKHVLCEKPLAMNAAEAQTVIDAARRSGTFLMEAFMYRCHPQIACLTEQLRAGAVGEVRHIQAAFGYDAGPRYEDIRNHAAMGGGSIMDVGCYCTSAARLVAGVATGCDFAEPVDVAGFAGMPAGAEVDQWAVAALKFPGEITAELVCGMQLQTEWTIRVFGSKGILELTDPWFGKRPQILIKNVHGEMEDTLACDDPRSPYRLEAEIVRNHHDAGQAPRPAPTWDDTLGNMHTLDRWRAAAGIRFTNDAD